MGCYISSNDNRFYAAMEASYGQVPTTEPMSRFPAVKLAVRHEHEHPERRDKTGSRTFQGTPAHLRKHTTFELRTYMTGWEDGTEPAHSPLFQAALGGLPVYFSGGTAGEGSAGRVLSFTAPHGLASGQGVTFGGELRFVTAIIGELSVLLNAPFSFLPSSGSPIGGTVTYTPGTELRSMSVLDYWSPAQAVQRILCGAAVDKMRILINGDFHEFRFSGAAKDVIDNASFIQGQGGLESFPVEPAGQEQYDYTLIPGHLGQAWLGSSPDRFFTITSAEIIVDNALDLRAREFGAVTPRCISAGIRSVLVDFDLYEQDDEATRELYQAARQRSPIEVMFQLGQQAGQLCGVYLKSVVPEVPDFDDGESRLKWRFESCRAQGTWNDELAVALG